MQSPARLLVLVAVVATTTANPGTAQTMTRISGDNQQVARAGYEIPGGRARFEPLVVQVVDDSGKPIARAPVTWVAQAPRGMACQLDPAGHGLARTVTDADGKATLNQMSGKSVYVYYASGKFRVTALHGDASVTFHLTALDMAPPPPPVPGAVMTLVSGDKQRVARVARVANRIPGGTARFQPLVVRLTDASGKPIPGARVTWVATCPQGTVCQSEPSGASPTTTPTDVDGKSTLNKMGGDSVHVYYGSGKFSMTASYGDARVTFHLAALDMAPADAK